jgi:RNA polymerase sigma-70 factor (ECF subfamily)
MAINRVTRRGPRAGIEPEMLDSVAARTTGPADEAERAEERAALRAGLRRLKAGDRATLEAFYLRGQSLKQMARTSGAPLGTIKRRLHVARKRLKDALVCA